MMIAAPHLGDFLALAGRRRRVAGSWDCCTFPAAWCIANGYPDPMIEWRGSYASEEDALDIARRGGGLATLFERGMAAAKIAPRLRAPQPGDVGVLSLAGHEAGAIFTGKRWAFVAERGLGFSSVEAGAVLAVWEVCYR